MSWIYLIGFGFPWALLVVWFIKVVAGRIVYLKERNKFGWSWEATERYGQYYQKKYKDAEIGERDD